MPWRRLRWWSMWAYAASSKGRCLSRSSAASTVSFPFCSCRSVLVRFFLSMSASAPPARRLQLPVFALLHHMLYPPLHGRVHGLVAALDTIEVLAAVVRRPGAVVQVVIGSGQV